MARKENQNPRRDQEEPRRLGDDRGLAAGLVAEVRDGARAEAAGRARQLRAIGELFSHTLDVAQEQARARQRQRGAGREHRRGDSPGSAFNGAHDLAMSLRILRENAVQETVAEVEVVLLIPRGTAHLLVHQAIIVTEHLPEVLRGLTSGCLSWAQAQVIIRHWSSISCDPAARTLVVAEDRENSENADPAVPAADVLVREMVDRAQFCSPGQLNDYGHRRRKELGVAAALRAHRNARLDRNVWVTAEEDGMAHLHAVLEAHKAIAVCDRIDRLARNQRPGSGPGQQPSPSPDDEQAAGPMDRRSIAQRRADVLTDLLLDAEPPVGSRLQRGVRGQVTVLVPAAVLTAADPDLRPRDVAPGARKRTATGASPKAAGQDRPGRAEGNGPPDGPPDAAPAPTEPDTADLVLRDPVSTDSASTDSTSTGSVPAGSIATGPIAPELLGYGPVPAQVAVQIAASAASWRRILTDPGTGVVTQYGRETYSVPAGLRRLLEIRDETCRFPGCRRSATACDLDHTTAWEHGGCTDAGNLACLCRAHHRTKHHPGTFGTWTITQRSTAGAGEPSEGGSRTGSLRVESPLGTVRPTATGYRGWKAILETTDLAEPLRVGPLRVDPPRVSPLRSDAAPPPAQAPPRRVIPDEQPPPF